MYLKISLRLLFFVVLGSSLTGCGAEQAVEDQPQLEANFYVRYVAENQELRGQASFFKEDSTTLSFPGGVAFMGSGTQQKQLPGNLLRYEGKMRVPFQTPSRFTFTMPGHDTPSEVKLSMTGINQFTINSASVSEGLRLTINDKLAADESLLLLFTDPNEEVRTIVRPGPFERTDLFIPADAVALFTPGAYRIYLVKSKQLKGEIPGLTYEASIEFYSNEKEFELKE
ncbi:hypothetical protein [Lewinella cohaerens]|uniref:hypothetical protein n=1 Tax=Lewinella cohaerens TaxID=70995 RepID=UPI00036B3118|nr:hypothetical protein [Lewinella cohaerens]